MPCIGKFLALSIVIYRRGGWIVVDLWVDIVGAGTVAFFKHRAHGRVNGLVLYSVNLVAK